MIQRKQTIFLLLAFSAMVLCFMFPIATFTAKYSLGAPVSGELNLVAKTVPDTMQQILNGDPVVMSQKGFIKVWPLTVLTILVALISLGSIFLYKNRPNQMKVVAVGFLLSVADIFLIFFWAVDHFVSSVTAPLACTDVVTHYSLGTWLPIAAVVFLFIAQRSIKSDEEKVRAADRLR